MEPIRNRLTPLHQPSISRAAKSHSRTHNSVTTVVRFLFQHSSPHLTALVALALFLPLAQLTAVAATDPIGYWKFEEGAGATAADSSGNGYVVTLSNATGWTTGKVGTALAAGTSATVASSAAFEPAQLTFALWAKATSAPTPYEGVAGKTSSSNWNNGYGFYYLRRWQETTYRNSD
ncbi:MAG: hypothetical protein FJ147_24415 [Deltaproteobacteria bacterium]|nr:hypothetical protein [Deltaproteobacteria bacterium]